MIGEASEPSMSAKQADRRVRDRATHSPHFRYAGPDTLVAKEAASIPRTPVGRALARARAILFGRPISLHEELSERLNVFTGLAVFASDNISSSAYATEEIMRVLVLAGVERPHADHADHHRDLRGAPGSSSRATSRSFRRIRRRWVVHASPVREPRDRPRAHRRGSCSPRTACSLCLGVGRRRCRGAHLDLRRSTARVS